MRIRIASTGLALALAACGSDGGEEGGFDDQQIIVDFADQVVVPTYQLLEERAGELDDAAIALAADVTDENLEAAREAWVELRVPWEQSEGFLFGPVSAKAWDPAMDTWPLNKTDFDMVIEGDDPINQELIRNLPESQKGFHAVEYLLWGQEGDRVAADIAEPRELEYLVALTEELTLITADLADSWTDGIDNEPAYRDVFATAGEDGNEAYPSLSSAAQEILDGMSGICDEVGTGKIAEPYDERNPNLVESQYSFNSLYDFQDNMRSVLNAYTGDFPAGGTEGRGLDAWVAERDQALDTRFKAEAQAAIDALGEIPAPFRDAITDPANDDLIEAAQQAIATVQATIDGDLTDVVLE